MFVFISFPDVSAQTTPGVGKVLSFSKFFDSLLELIVVKKNLQIISEIGLIISYPIFSFFAQIVPKRNLEGQGEGRTIVIVERWLSRNIRHIQWKSFLEKKGFRVYLANFSLYKGSFEDSAKELQKYIEKRELKNIVIVGISSGALTSLIYLQELHGWDNVEKFITIGAPFKGTPTALHLSFLRSGRQLLPKSALVKKISQYEIQNPDRIYCFRATFDEMVPFGSVLEGSHEIRINAIGHNNLHLGIGRTYERIAELVRK